MVRVTTWMVTVAAWACCARGSVLVPTYVLPPDSFVRDQRSLGRTPTNDDSTTADTQRTIRRLVGGHMKIRPEKEYGNPTKNSFAFNEKSESGKFKGVIAQELSGGNVGWNQGIWDDGMLMSSAGEGKEAIKNTKYDDEDKKTLSDQVAEGKYGLIQNEIFSKTPKRPGIVSYETNSETRSKDNVHTLGGLKKEEIWLAEDHLLVLKGGSFPETGKETEHRPWPPIDDYEAPRRQVKLPQKPKVPPPFPVRLSDDGPLVFLTPNGSVPAAFFPPFSAGEGDSSFPSAPFPFPPGPPYAQSEDQGNITAGRTPYPIPSFPFFPGNASEGTQFPFLSPINASFAEGFPPGAAFLPPPSNQTDLYDEDDPSIYYPPPYNFSYLAENSSVPAGPLVPGIVLPPPPDFFAPLEEKTTLPNGTPAIISIKTAPITKQKPLTKRPPLLPHRKPIKTRPTTAQPNDEVNVITTPKSVEIITTPKFRQTLRVVEIPKQSSVQTHHLIEEPSKPEKPIYKTRQKVTSKPLSVSVIYDYPEDTYNNKIPTTTSNPYVLYSVTTKSPNLHSDNIVTSTPVPLKAYYSNVQNDNFPTTKLQPVQNQKPKENSVASFYFYDETPKSTPAPVTYFDGRNYYKTITLPQTPTPQQNINTESGFSPSINIYGPIDQPDSLFLWPQKQGPRTLTQEYFTIQNTKPQHIYGPPKLRPESFYQQISDIQQAIDFFTTKRPKQHSHRTHNVHKPKAITSRPVYQFSYQTKQRPDHITFRAPKLDPEPFRPMVSYSKPFNVENEFNAITPSISPAYHQQYLIENVKVTTETPTSSKYYPKTKSRDDDYEDTQFSKEKKVPQKSTKFATQTHKDTSSLTVNVNSLNPNQHLSTTPNPINHGYYTKQDERYFDDITKNSFDIFGKKIEDNNNDINSIAVTPPLSTVRTPIDNNINLQYAYEVVEPERENSPSLEKDILVNQRLPRPPINPDSEPIPPHIQNSEIVIEPKPPSLIDDTLVNDRLPRPPINPDSEFVPIPNPAYRSQEYNIQGQTQGLRYTSEQLDLNRPSLSGDTTVNFKEPLPPINPDAEWIAPVNAAGEGRPGSFVSYRLPGEGAHVYFLTPQAAQAVRARYNSYRTPAYGR